MWLYIFGHGGGLGSVAVWAVGMVAPPWRKRVVSLCICVDEVERGEGGR